MSNPLLHHKTYLNANVLGDISSVFLGWKSVMGQHGIRTLPGGAQHSTHPHRPRERTEISHTLPPNFVVFSSFQPLFEKLAITIRALEEGGTVSYHDARMLKHMKCDLMQAGYYLKYIIQQPGDADPHMQRRLTSNDLSHYPWDAERQLRKVNAILKHVYHVPDSELIDPKSDSKFDYAAQHAHLDHFDQKLSNYVKHHSVTKVKDDALGHDLKRFREALLGAWVDISAAVERMVAEPTAQNARKECLSLHLDNKIKAATHDLTLAFGRAHIPPERTKTIITRLTQSLSESGGLGRDVHRLLEAIPRIPDQTTITNARQAADPAYHQRITREYVDRTSILLRSRLEDITYNIVNALHEPDTSVRPGTGDLGQKPQQMR